MRTGPKHPILGLRRAETEAVCDRFDLIPFRDPSNQDRRFVRNRVRHELLPLCSAIAGRDVVPILARQAIVLQGDADILEAVGSLVEPENAAMLAAAPVAVGRRSVRNWLTGEGPYPPPLDAVDRVLEVARQNRRATETPGGRTVRRSGGRLSLVPPTGSDDPNTAPIQSGR
jgi:tRNA(Ile)-lysidine synthase